MNWKGECRIKKKTRERKKDNSTEERDEQLLVRDMSLSAVQMMHWIIFRFSKICA